MASIILTRSDDDNTRMAAELVARGHTVVSAPMIELRSIEQPPGLIESLATAVRGSTVLITSAHAARLWLELRGGLFADDAPAHYVVVGATSAAILQELDPTVPVLAVVPAARDLADAVPTRTRRIIYPCSRARRDEGIEIFRSRGIEVLELPLYEPVLPADAALRLAHALETAAPPRIIIFHSPSAVTNWFSLRSDIPSDSIFLAIGPTTTDSLHSHGVRDVTTAGGTGAAAIADAVDAALRGRPDEPRPVIHN